MTFLDYIYIYIYIYIYKDTSSRHVTNRLIISEEEVNEIMKMRFAVSSRLILTSSSTVHYHISLSKAGITSTAFRKNMYDAVNVFFINRQKPLNSL